MAEDLHFPRWRTVLVQSDLPPELRRGYQITLRWYLRICKRLGESHIKEFLDHLAVERRASVSAQKQALNALVFLYREAV